MISFFDPDRLSPTSYLHSAEYPHLPTLVFAVCLQDLAGVTLARAQHTPEPALAAGHVGYRIGWPLPAFAKSPSFTPSAQIATFARPGLILPAREWDGPMPSRAVRVPERAHAACWVVARRGASLAGCAKSRYFVHCPEAVGCHTCVI